MRLYHSPLFLSDASDCAEYLSDHADESVVEAWREALKQALALIKQVPEIGRVRQDLPQTGIRTLNLRKHPDYLIFYRLVEERIELLRVRHGMMHLPGLFSEDPPAQAGT